MTLGTGDSLSRHGESKDLVVMVHGMSRKPRDFDELRAKLITWLPDADHFAPQLPLGLFSTWDAHDVSAVLQSRIENIADQKPYRDIYLVGHSSGALIIRAAWLRANGVRLNGDVELDDRASWARRVKGITLLAALGRGWRPTIAMSPLMRLAFWAANVWEIVEILPRLLTFQHRRGAAFLTTIRLQSLALDMAARKEELSLPRVAQVLGTVDQLIAPADNIDLVTGGQFTYIEAPGADHLGVVAPSTPALEGALHLAITGRELPWDRRPYSVLTALDVADLYSDAADDFDQALPVKHRRTQGPKINTAVMIVHGIRDYGYWTKRLAGAIKARAKGRPGIECRTVTSSYGFFPMAPFVSRAIRRRRVEWFMDQFVQARALYPDAQFSFVGHSNGTYLLAGALAACPAIKFGPVVFAGSVVRTDYEWSDALKRKQVSRVLNYVATDDLIVAGFPKFLGRLGAFDLGGAGTDGFVAVPDIENMRFVAGGHGAAIVESNWDTIADFVLTGEVPDPPAPAWITRSRRSEFFLTAMSVILVPLAIAVALGVAYVSYRLAVRLDMLTLRTFFAAVITLVVVGTVVTKF